MLQPSWEELLTFSSEMVFITLYLLSNLIIDEVVTTTIRSATLVFTLTCPKLKYSISSRYIQQGRNEGWCYSMNFHRGSSFKCFCTRCIYLKAWDLVPQSVFPRFRPGTFPHATKRRYWKTNILFFPLKMASVFSSRRDLNLIFSRLWPMFFFLRTERLLLCAGKQLSVFARHPFLPCSETLLSFPPRSGSITDFSLLRTTCMFAIAGR